VGEQDQKPAVIFDFDGTIADSLVATLHVLYDLVHHKPLPKEDISRLRGMGIRAMLHALHIPLWRALLLISRTRHGLTRYMDDIELIDGMDNAVRELSKTHELFVLSSNDVPSIRVFLKRFHLDRYFTDVVGEATPWYKSRALKRLMRQHNLASSTTWYVGDRTWDVQAARRVHAKSVAVAWGYSNLHVLRSNQPDALVFTPEELVTVLQKERSARG